MNLEDFNLNTVAYWEPVVMHRMAALNDFAIFGTASFKMPPPPFSKFMTNEVCRARRILATRKPPKKGGRLFESRAQMNVAHAVRACAGIKPDTEGLDSRGDGSNGRSNTMRRQVLQRCSTGTSQG